MNDPAATVPGGTPPTPPGGDAPRAATAAGKARNDTRTASLKRARDAKAQKARENAERAAKKAAAPKAAAAQPAQPGIANPQDLAQLLAELDVNAQAVSAGSPRVNFVARSLSWGEAHVGPAGLSVKPTPRALMACQMMWPALLRWGILEGLSDNVMFGLGAFVLIGPAVGTTIAVLRAPADAFRPAAPTAPPPDHQHAPQNDATQKAAAA